MARFRLYGMSHSLYTGKARSYLIKQNVDFEEVTAGHPRYRREVMPKTGRWIIPVLVTPEGEIVQDGTDIIDWFETRGLARQSAYPKAPRQLLTSLIFELFGGEGLLRPAMHYRWNFDADNKTFIEDQFGLFAMPQLPAEERRAIIEQSTGRMRSAARSFGVVPATMGVVEEAYLEFLAELNEHLSACPYLLGGAPTLGDYGLIAPLFAHLGRDPHPAKLMKQVAPAVFRFTERMNATGPDMPEFLDATEDLFAADEIPDTLRTLLKRVAADYVPEVEAFVAFQNQWTADHHEISEGDAVGGERLTRAIGGCSFEWRGHTIQAAVMPYRVFMLQRIQDAFDGLDAAGRTAVQPLLEETGVMPLVATRADRRVERMNNREVWGAA